MFSITLAISADRDRNTVGVDLSLSILLSFYFTIIVDINSKGETIRTLTAGEKLVGTYYQVKRYTEALLFNLVGLIVIMYQKIMNVPFNNSINLIETLP